MPPNANDLDKTLTVITLMAFNAYIYTPSPFPSLHAYGGSNPHLAGSLVVHVPSSVRDPSCLLPVYAVH